MVDFVDFSAWQSAVRERRATQLRNTYMKAVHAQRLRASPPPETPQERKYRERFGAAWDMLTQADIKTGACVLVVNQDGLLSDALWDRYERERSGVKAEFYRPSEDGRSRGSYDVVLANNCGTDALYAWLLWTCKLSGCTLPISVADPVGLPHGRSLVAGGKFVAKTLRDNVTAAVMRAAHFAGARVLATADPRAVVLTAQRKTAISTPAEEVPHAE